MNDHNKLIVLSSLLEAGIALGVPDGSADDSAVGDFVALRNEEISQI
eukprot:CAMPEP_0202711122 /NCGR_PEP_ID=MMETSP1385-20130828/22993_1 /ASSEMBLY_ACC=CAM_ASM_000861 /TAXON_ID=933848 /ORGANISM="Elphidium margaritaceum" /LENGTH=46 /DNA_ID= /DNA_START= /DNA_END= /DNA_ORIENTATION=